MTVLQEPKPGDGVVRTGVWTPVRTIGKGGAVAASANAEGAGNYRAPQGPPAAPRSRSLLVAQRCHQLQLVAHAQRGIGRAALLRGEKRHDA